MPKHYTADERQSWLVLADQGLSNRKIAEATGVSLSTLKRWIPARPPKQPSPETIAEWQKMLDDEGMAYKHIAQIYGVCQKTVQKHLPGRAWTPQQISAHGTSVRRFNATKLSLVG